MSKIKERLEQLMSLKMFMTKYRITIQELRDNWFLLNEYMDDYKQEQDMIKNGLCKHCKNFNRDLCYCNSFEERVTAHQNDCSDFDRRFRIE